MKPSTRSPLAKPTVRFTLESDSKRRGIFVLPKNIPGGLKSAILTTKNTAVKNIKGVAIEGVIKFLPFQGTIDADSAGNYELKLNTTTSKAALAAINKIENKAEAEKIEVELMNIDSESETRMPTDFREALDSAPKAKSLWEEITPIARRDWIYWMTTAKLRETRERRIKNACNMLASGKRRVCCFGGVGWMMKNG